MKERSEGEGENGGNGRNENEDNMFFTLFALCHLIGKYKELLNSNPNSVFFIHNRPHTATFLLIVILIKISKHLLHDPVVEGKM